jgi:hypothetical protein
VQETLLGAVVTVVPGDVEPQVMPVVFELPTNAPLVNGRVKPGTVRLLTLKPMSSVLLGIALGGA